MKTKNIIHLAARSDKGKVRENNEDRLYIDGTMMPIDITDHFTINMVSIDRNQIWAVCDGMGGQNSGEVASGETVLQLLDFVKRKNFKNSAIAEKTQSIHAFLRHMNEKLLQMAQKEPDKKGMGTTFTAVIASEGKLAAVNVGDSRVYRFRDAGLTQITQDHTESERMVRLGMLSREQARVHKSRHILNRHLGMPSEAGTLEADVSYLEDMQDNDIYLVCSDGLTDMVEDEEIQTILHRTITLNQMADDLLHSALTNGGRDNVTFILAEVTSKPVKFSILNKILQWLQKHWYPIAFTFLLMLAIFYFVADIYLIFC